ncbi:phosphotransferase (plasmid) [Mesorhizobium sp. AR07]|uniref:phosphotransferase enzyme family protein n=1 Tax=Mesorhizobium sp. AR07 TaxID=2865838 RepID=UPI00216055FB|nr:phosphotransferase [Mesorhizobium sp. AR07]UVK48093.1 phosphotransferase [Mesorhizobium sp. AR07]
MTETNTHVLDEQLAAMNEAAERALASWPGRFRDMTLVKYRENAVYSLYDDAGQRFALRVHRPGYHSDAELRSELLWMSALATAGVPVPGIVPTRDGALFVKVELPERPVMQIDMLVWLAGQPIGSIEDIGASNTEALRDHYVKAGVLAARLHNFGEGWQMPDGFARHAWDAGGLIGEDPFWGKFRELPALAEHRDLIETACRKAETELAALGRRASVYGLIHADFVPENLLHADGSLLLIDFDDAGFGWHMFELATALYFYLDTPYYDAVRDALVAGYRSERALSDAHWAQLPLFLLLRSITYLSWVHTRRETETAQELTPMFVERTVELARRYLM